MADNNATIPDPAGAKAGAEQPAGDQSQGNPAADDQASSRSKAFEAVDHWKSQATKAQQELDKFRADAKAAEEKRLSEQGEFRTIAETRAAELEQARKDLQEERINNALLAEAQAAGLKPNRLKLVDRSLVKIEGGNVIGAAEALKALKESDPELFGSGNPDDISVRTANAPGGGGRGFDPSKVKPADVAKLSPEEWKQYKEAKYGTATSNGNFIPVVSRTR